MLLALATTLHESVHRAGSGRLISGCFYTFSPSCMYSLRTSWLCMVGRCATSPRYSWTRALRPLGLHNGSLLSVFLLLRCNWITADMPTPANFGSSTIARCSNGYAAHSSRRLVITLQVRGYFCISEGCYTYTVVNPCDSSQESGICGRSGLPTEPILLHAYRSDLAAVYALPLLR